MALTKKKRGKKWTNVVLSKSGTENYRTLTNHQPLNISEPIF